MRVVYSRTTSRALVSHPKERLRHDHSMRGTIALRLGPSLALALVAEACCFGLDAGAACEDTCLAAERGDLVPLANIALHDRAGLRCTDAEGAHPLQRAARAGTITSLAWLIEHDVPIEEQGRRAHTALYDAGRAGQTEAVTWLLDHGADVEAVGEGGYDAWIGAAELGQIEVLEILERRGADTHATTTAGADALISYAHWGQPDDRTATYLLDHGATIDMHNVDGRTALHFAVLRHDTALVRVLIDAGASPSAVTENGTTVLSSAEQVGFDDIASLLRARRGRVRTDAARLDVTPPLTQARALTGAVTFSNGARPVELGTRCTVSIEPVVNVPPAGPAPNCQVAVRCGERNVYGGGPIAVTFCDERGGDLRAFDPFDTLRDGDPSLVLGVSERLVQVDDGLRGREGTRVRIELDAPL